MEKPDVVDVNAPTDDFRFSEKPSMEDIRRIQHRFCHVRNWTQYQTPRNLLLALVGEVGEVAELFQWKGEVAAGIPDWTPKERESLAHELSDVLIYLLRLSEVCNVDLPKEALAKIALNEQKYPADKCFGSNKKYDQL
jgi:dCTP diphosphatase